MVTLGVLVQKDRSTDDVERFLTFISFESLLLEELPVNMDNK